MTASDKSQPPAPEAGEFTGGSVNYYKVQVPRPTTLKAPYTAECNDIIEALGMNYAEANVFKALWRSCAARNLKLTKKGHADGVYDAEKAVFFSARVLVQRQHQRDIASVAQAASPPAKAPYTTKELTNDLKAISVPHALTQLARESWAMAYPSAASSQDKSLPPTQSKALTESTPSHDHSTPISSSPIDLGPVGDPNSHAPL